MTREELNQKKHQEIVNEQRHERRKQITIIIFKFSFILIVSFILFYLYTTYISSKLVTVKEERIVDKNIPSNFNGLKIVHFSDLHFGSTIFYNETKKLVNKINQRKPDLIIFTGDLIDEKYELKTDDQEKIINILKKLDAELGKYAVKGEEDDEVFDVIMKQSNFTILDNDYDLIYDNSSQPILLVGLGSSLNDNLDIDSAFSYFNAPENSRNLYTIVCSHEPDTISEVLESRSANLYLAGHSHNGSIVLPFVGAMYKERGSMKYYNEFYAVDDTDLYISSGIGSNGPGFRLFCRPSFNFFRISSK